MKPDYSDGSWINPNVMNNDLDKTSVQREVALFVDDQIIGFEEIIKKILVEMQKLDEQKERKWNFLFKKEDTSGLLYGDERALDYRNFTAIVKSSTAKMYFLKREHLETFTRYLSDTKLKLEMKNREDFMQSQVDIITKINKDEHLDRQRSNLTKKLLIPSHGYQIEDDQVDLGLQSARKAIVQTDSGNKSRQSTASLSK